MSKQPPPFPVKVPDALMSAMGFTVAELNPDLMVAPVACLGKSRQIGDSTSPAEIPPPAPIGSPLPSLTSALAARRAIFGPLHLVPEEVEHAHAA